MITYHISDENLSPCHSCEYECLKPGVCCPNVANRQKNLMDAICNADLVYYIVPNFCGYPCSSYFAFNERGVGYFNMDRSLMGKYMAVKKKFIIISNTESDTFVNAMKQQTSAAPEILYLKTSKYGKHSTAGDLLDSKEAQVDLENFINDGIVK